MRGGADNDNRYAEASSHRMEITEAGLEGHRCKTVLDHSSRSPEVVAALHS